MGRLLTDLKAQIREAMAGSDQPWALSILDGILAVSSGPMSLDFRLSEGYDDSGDPLTAAHVTQLTTELQALLTAHNASL